MKALTINDVAKHAGVSKRTVTRVLNNHTDVKESTRAKVKAVIAELNYVPNSLAQRLASGHSELIGIYAYAESFPLERTQFFYPFVEGVEMAAQRLAYDVLLFTRGGEGEERSMFSGNSSRTDLADGLVILGASVNHRDLQKLADMNRPFVCIGRRESTGYPINYVAADYASAFYDATMDLVFHKHKHIAFVSPLTFEAEQDKYSGYENALLESGLPVYHFDPDQCSQNSDLPHFIKEKGITAIVIPYPHHLPPILHNLPEYGIRIPKDLSLVAFDTQTMTIEGLSINHVTIPKEEMGQRAVEMLVSLVQQNNTNTPLQCSLPCHYIRGETVRTQK